MKKVYNVIVMVLAFGVVVNDAFSIGSPCSLCDRYEFDYCTGTIGCVGLVAYCGNCVGCDTSANPPSYTDKCDWTKCEMCNFGTGGPCDKCIGCIEDYCAIVGQTCCNGYCCKPANCEECDGAGHCLVCGGGQCYTKGNCMYCNNGIWESSCTEGTHCENERCICDLCNAWQEVLPNTIPLCPECSDEMGGCYSDHLWIQVRHDYITGSEPPHGDVGICGTPTVDANVGVHTFCIKNGLNVAPIIACAIEAGLAATDCFQCVSSEGGDVEGCVSCLYALIGGDFDCINHDLCIYITGCRHCYGWEDCSFPITEDIVDWYSNITFCYP